MTLFFNNCCNNRHCCNNNCIPIPGPRGPKGESATIAVGSTTTSPFGTNALVTNSGTTSNAVLNFTIPRGEPGTSATINVGTTTTLPQGNKATVTNVGTSTNAILNFGIPSGGINIINSGSFISKSTTRYTSNNSIINLPTTLNNTGININENSIITLPKSGRYLINYGIKASTTNNEIGLYINGINNSITNIETLTNDLNPSSSIILNLNENDVIALGVINASVSFPLTLQSNTINAYLTIISLD